MSLALVRAGLYLTITSCGPYSGCEVSTCDFGVLETNSGSCITFLPEGTSTFEPRSFGPPAGAAFGTVNQRNYHRSWSIGGKLWIRDTGTPTVVLDKLWQAYDDLFNTISKDDSLNGSSKEAHVAAIGNQFGVFFKQGGQLWKPVDFIVIASDLIP